MNGALEDCEEAPSFSWGRLTNLTRFIYTQLMGVMFLICQILLFALLFLLSNLFTALTAPFPVCLILYGVVVGALGLLTMDRRSYSPLPKPRKHNVLVRRGIYRILRHPMYAGLLSIGLAFMLSRFAPLSAILYAAFAVITNLKANLEEKLMSEKHPEYSTYRQKTKKYIPLVY